MTKKLCVFLHGCLFLFCFSYAQAAYQYTYTSGPMGVVDFMTETVIPTDEVVKVVITSDALLTADSNLYGNAYFQFSYGDYVTSNIYPSKFPPPYIFSDLSISAYDEQGLPSAWYFDLYQKYISGTDDFAGFYSDTESTRFFQGLETPGGPYLLAVGGVGSWQLTEVSAPVPELPSSAMFLFGLGLLAMVKRRKM